MPARFIDDKEAKLLVKGEPCDVWVKSDKFDPAVRMGERHTLLLGGSIKSADGTRNMSAEVSAYRKHPEGGHILTFVPVS